MIVGLGNPGVAYEKTRHNVGFRTVDRVAGILQTEIDNLRFCSLMRMVHHRGQKVLLLKPQTYMNESGKAVATLAEYYNIPPERIIVVFDDISLPVGKIRIRRDGSAGGHNGVKSVIQCLGTDQFPRVKVGVGAKPHPDYDLADWVLGTFPKDQRSLMEETYKKAANAALLLMEKGPEAAANKYNGK